MNTVTELETLTASAERDRERLLQLLRRARELKPEPESDQYREGLDSIGRGAMDATALANELREREVIELGR